MKPTVPRAPNGLTSQPMKVPGPLDRSAARYARLAHREQVRLVILRRLRNPLAPVSMVGRILCDANTRTGDPCRKPGTGAGFRCALHGGKSKKLSGFVKYVMHGFFSRAGRSGVRERLARVRREGGLDADLRKFLSENAKSRWAHVRACGGLPAVTRARLSAAGKRGAARRWRKRP